MKDTRTLRRTIKVATAIALAALVLIGCIHTTGQAVLGNGTIVTQSKSAQGFSTVALAIPGNMRIHPGEEYRLVITTDSNIMDMITVEVRGSALTIGVERNANINPTELTIDVYLPALRSLSLVGSGHINVGELSASSLDISIIGAGAVTLASGSASSLSVIISGSGDISAENFQASDVEVVISGAGVVSTWATNSISGVISGMGVILYRGDPRIDVVIAGAGQVMRL